MTDSSRSTPLPASEVRSAPLPPPAQGSAPNDDVPAGSERLEAALVAYPGRTPREGELTTGWRIITAITGIAVILAFATVWNVSVQLGLSTWWLGPRGQPQPRLVQLTPFFGPLLMVLGAINQVRWLAWFGLLASAVLAGFGVIDIVRIGALGVLEVVIAGLAAAVSAASLTGTYRPDQTASSPPIA